jgi:diguanylate cyclase (GGDEF)-like protein
MGLLEELGVHEAMNAPGVRILTLVWALMALSCPSWAEAATMRINAPLCHAVTPVSLPDSQAARLVFSCAGEPAGYQEQSLWLHVDLTRLSVDPHDAALLVHQSRFDSLTILFAYADGRTVRQSVRRGASGTYWRVGGQLAFEAPGRDAPLSSITLRFNHVASHKLLRMQLLSRGAANNAASLAALLIGGAITMLLLGTIYNISLAVAVRRQFLAWHGMWAAIVLVWGLFWSQLALAVLPHVAGTASAQICTLLSCVAVAAAAISAITSLGENIPRFASIGVLILSVIEAGLGVPAALTTSARIDLLATVLAVTILGLLIAVALCIGWAWRRGSREARDCAFAWSVPMATLAATQVFDMSDVLFGGGAQIAVLFAAALQTVWLSAAATRRLGNLRVERDVALAAETFLNEIANSDPLTGLLNRRGFVARAEQLLRVEGSRPPAPFGLLLIDVDHFKSINDEFGHEAGDAVLHRLAQRLLRWESASCAVGRLGGEEFVVAISGLAGLALSQFAESVRRELAACDHLDATVDRRVTASIGVVEARAGSSFQELYGLADQVLYQAKHAGRDCVRMERVEEVGSDAGTAAQPPRRLWPTRVAS